jgi:hypothetical protein
VKSSRRRAWSQNTLRFGDKIDHQKVDLSPIGDEWRIPCGDEPGCAGGADVRRPAWQCFGFNADTFDEPTTIEVSNDGIVEVEVPLDDGAQIEVRADLVDEQVTLAPQPDRSYRVPDGATSLLVSVCTADDRCGFYRPQLD